MAEQTARELLAEADRHKRIADAAEYARTLIRLGEPVQQSRGILGFWKRHPERPHVFDEATTWAVYEALATVVEHHEQIRRRLEARVEVSRG